MAFDTSRRRWICLWVIVLVVSIAVALTIPADLRERGSVRRFLADPTRPLSDDEGRRVAAYLGRGARGRLALTSTDEQRQRELVEAALISNETTGASRPFDSVLQQWHAGRAFQMLPEMAVDHMNAGRPNSWRALVELREHGFNVPVDRLDIRKIIDARRDISTLATLIADLDLSGMRRQREAYLDLVCRTEIAEGIQRGLLDRIKHEDQWASWFPAGDPGTERVLNSPVDSVRQYVRSETAARTSATREVGR